MRKLIVSTFLTLDGVMQAPGGPGEDDSGGFAFGGWSVNYWDDLMGEVMTQAMSRPFDLLLGRRTYDLQVHGSGNLIQTLMRHNLVDEYRLWVFPVLLGSGKRLFADGTIPAGLKLVDTRVSTTGVVIGTYEPAGEVVLGSFA